MMKIKLITVGKLKENYLKEGISEYSKRLRRFSSFEMIELMDEKTPDKASPADNQIILNKEADRILPKITDREFVFVLAIEGKEFSSKDFSQRIQTATIKGFSNITFVIGGSLGLSEKVKKRADVLMSFGTLTFPHQLMRLILVEQVYRAFMIQEGSPYHK